MSTINKPGRRFWDRCLLACGVVWLAVQISPLWYPTPDSAAYLSLGRSLGQRGEIRNHGSPQAFYPLGYPLLLAPLFALDAEPFLLIALLHFALAVGLMALVYRWAATWAPEHAAWLAVATVVTVSFGNVYRRPLSEMAFMAAIMLTAAAMRWLARDFVPRDVCCRSAAWD